MKKLKKIVLLCFVLSLSLMHSITTINAQGFIIDTDSGNTEMEKAFYSILTEEQLLFLNDKEQVSSAIRDLDSIDSIQLKSQNDEVVTEKYYELENGLVLREKSTMKILDETGYSDSLKSTRSTFYVDAEYSFLNAAGLVNMCTIRANFAVDQPAYRFVGAYGSKVSGQYTITNTTSSISDKHASLTFYMAWYIGGNTAWSGTRTCSVDMVYQGPGWYTYNFHWSD